MNIIDLDQVDELDVVIDGADEVDPKNNLIKGGGGALLMEKIVASHSKQFIVIVDDSKIVSKLGKFPLPIEIVRFGSEKTKSSVETNQAVSKLRYEVIFIYTLVLNEKNCVTFNKKLISYFSIIPKSSGYNYGTDSSLEKKYELAITENLNRFVSIILDKDLNSCLWKSII